MSQGAPVQKYLLSSHYESSPLLGVEELGVNKRQDPGSHGAYILAGKRGEEQEINK